MQIRPKHLFKSYKKSRGCYSNRLLPLAITVMLVRGWCFGCPDTWISTKSDFILSSRVQIFFNHSSKLTLLTNMLAGPLIWSKQKVSKNEYFSPIFLTGPHSLPYWVTKNAAVTIMGCFLGQVKYGEGRPLITSHVMRNTMELSWLGRTHFLPYVWLSETTWGLVIVTMVTLIQHDGQHFTGVLC